MESILGTGAAVEPAPLQPAAERERKRPGLAFLLSLVFPGAGLVYCGKRSAGIATAVFFSLAIGLAVFLPSTNPLFGVGVRSALVLYGYAFLDSFYTAREVNAGMAQYMVGNNPRIAAMLNLITTGFGYFYLGERKKGIAVFIGLRVFDSMVQSAKGPGRTPLLVLLEIILAVFAFDAHRLARKQLREAFLEVDLDPFAKHEGLSALVPAALAGLFAFNYVALVCFGLAMPDFRQVGESGSIVAKDGGDHSYVNLPYGVSVTFPAEWKVAIGTEANNFVGAKKFNGGCSVQLVAEARLPIVSTDAYTAILRKNLEKDKLGFRWLSEKPTTLGDNAGRVESFVAQVREVEIRQDYVVAPHGLSMFALVETAATGLMGDCAGDFDTIRQSVRLK